MEHTNPFYDVIADDAADARRKVKRNVADVLEDLAHDLVDLDREASIARTHIETAMLFLRK